jgi:hypothetical protein
MTRPSSFDHGISLFEFGHQIPNDVTDGVIGIAGLFIKTEPAHRNRVNRVLTIGAQGAAMTRFFLLGFLSFLAACSASPAPEFFGANRTEVSRNGRDYVVFQKGNRVEIVRLGYARRGEHQEIRATMIELIPEVTGCRLRESTLQGDSGEMHGSVTCG